MGDSPTENLMQQDNISDFKTKSNWAADSKDDVPLFKEGIGEGVEADIPDSEEVEHVSCGSAASDDSLSFVRNKYCSSGEAPSTRRTAPLFAYAKFADIVLQSADEPSGTAGAGVSGRSEGEQTEWQLKKGLIQSILSSLGSKRRTQRAGPPPPALEEPAAASGGGVRGLLRALLSSVSRRGALPRVQEVAQTLAAPARSDTAAARRSVATVEKVGSRLRSMQQLLQAQGEEEDEAILQQVVTELRSQLSDAEAMVAEIAPLVGKRSSRVDLQGTLETMTTKLLALREVLRAGPDHGGGFSQLDVQAAFLEARGRLREAQAAAARLGPSERVQSVSAKSC